jgi:WD40 repeat protein
MFNLADGFSSMPMDGGALSDEDRARLMVKHLRRWDVVHGRELPEFTDAAIAGSGQQMNMRSGAVSGQGDVAVSLYGIQQGAAGAPAENDSALLWRAGRPDRAERIPLGVGEQLKSLAFTPNGKVLAGIVVHGDEAEQGVLRLWSVDRLRALRTVSVEVDYKLTITFSSDGSLLYFAPAVYETRTLRQVALVQRQSAGDLAAFAPGNRQLAIDQDHKVILWDVEARRQLGAAIDAGGPAVGKGGGYDAEGESFSPDGSWMATAYRGHRLELWRNPLVGWPELACSVANRNLTPDEWSLYFGSQPYRKTCPALPAGENIPAN